jgi:hypothetical protein
MSLEEALNENTKAVLAHNALLEKMLAGGKPAASAATGTKAPAASGTKAPAAAGAKPAAGKAPTKPALTTEVVAERVTSYLKTGSKEEREAHKEHVRLIIEHYGATKFTAMDPEDMAAGMADLDTFEAGNTPDWYDAPDEAVDEEEGMV